MMLAQFQSLYQEGSITSELLQIHNGKHIVRVTVQLKGITRTTGMAASEVIEEAEDRAVERALSLLPESIDSVVRQPESDKSANGNESAGEVSLEVEKHTSKDTSQDVPFVSKQKSQEKSKAITPRGLRKAIADDNQPVASEESVRVDPSESSYTESSNTESFQTEEHLSPIPLESLYSEAANTGKDLDTESASTIKSESEEVSEIDNSAPLVTNVVDLPVQQQEEQLPLISPEEETPQLEPEPETKKATKTTKKKTTTSRRKKKTESAPVDDSDTIAKIGVEMKRLGWTIEDGREHLRKTYSKISRHLLTPEELQDFLSYLETQEVSSLEPLPLDPNF